MIGPVPDLETAPTFSGWFTTTLEGQACRLELFTSSSGVLKGQLYTHRQRLVMQGYVANQGQFCYGFLLLPDTGEQLAHFKLKLEAGQLRLELEKPDWDNACQESLNLGNPAQITN